MARPEGGYRLKDGTSVPGVSTVAKIGQDMGGLQWWIWNEGREGRSFEETKKKAANTGTIAHDMVDCWIHKRPWLRPEWATDEQVAQAGVAFSAFLRWAEGNQFVITHTELTLVSETYRVGGTLDASACTIRGRRSMLDWKTSNDTYPEHLVQVKGYGLLWDEAFPDDPVVDGYHIVRFGKEYGNFSHHWWPELDVAGRAFLLKRELYDHAAVLKKMAK